MTPADIELARLAVAWGWLSHQNSVRCLREADRCHAMGLAKGVEDILLEEGRLTDAQIRQLRRFLGWSLERPRVGGFEVIRRIGLGGTGSVFEARHVRLNQRVALKVLYPRLAGNARITGLFLREARVLARLNHPHLVHAFDAGRDGEYYYLAMEYIEGENLLQLLTRTGVLEPSRALAIIKAVCGALTALEARHLVHRDIKPANILLTADGGVKLADLGLLKVETNIDGPGEDWVSGTPHYLAPEQALGGGREDTRSDLYSLGATWYHALAGRPPFVGRSSREILRAHSLEVPAPLRTLRRDLSAATDRTVLSWLAKDPGQRPQTSLEALRQLELLERRSFASVLTRSGSPFGLMFALGVFLLAAALVMWALSPGEELDSTSPRRQGGATPLGAQPEGAPGDGGAEQDTVDTRVETVGTAHGVAGAAPPRPSSRRAAPEEPSAAELHEGVEAAVITPSAAPPTELFRVAASIAAGFERMTVRLGDDLKGHWSHLEQPVAVARARFDGLRPLLAAMHAPVAALGPVVGDEVGLLVEYDFASSSELDDFRARPGSIAIASGGLVASEAGFAAAIESVYWLKPPLRLAAVVHAGTRVTVGFGSLRVALREGARPVTWDADDASFRSARLPTKSPAPTTFDLHLAGDRLQLAASDSSYEEAVRAPARGRVTLAFERGGIDWLRIEAALEMVWARERLRHLETHSPAGALDR